jgi:hypothetical protein
MKFGVALAVADPRPRLGAVTSPDPYADLAEEFAAACEVGVQECKALGYPPNIWISMSRNLGAAEAARRLMVSGDIQSGFERLIAEGRPYLTIEWVVVAYPQ